MARLLQFAVLTLISSFAGACMRVTPSEPGMPATRCKTCSMDLLMKTQIQAGAKEFTSDRRDDMGACSTRTLTCTGMNAVIEVNNRAGIVTNPAVLTVVCNTAGTAWVDCRTGVCLPVNQVECSSTDP